MEWLYIHPSEYHPIVQVIIGIIVIFIGMWLHQLAWEKKAEYLRGYKYKKIKKQRRLK
jgi:hypothetical protein